MPAGLAALAGYCALTIVVLWPLARAPHRLVIPNDDTYGNVWVMAWVVHQAVRDPLHLFAGNIFFPHPYPLAFMESLIPQALQASPLLLLGASPLLGHNLVLLLTFPLCGLGAHVLARELGASRLGSFLAGLGYAFCSYRFGQIVNIQTLSMQWLPLAILFTRRACHAGRWRDCAAAGLFLLLQALSSGYYAILCGVTIGLTILWHARTVFGSKAFVRLGVCLTVACLLVGAVFLPYRWAMDHEREVRGYGMERPEADMIAWSAQPGSYLSPGLFAMLPHQRWLYARFGGHGGDLYPTITLVVFAACALALWRRHEPVAFLAFLAAAGVLLSFGPKVQIGPWEVPGPFALLRIVPGVSMLRIPGAHGRARHARTGVPRRARTRPCVPARSLAGHFAGPDVPALPARGLSSHGRALRPDPPFPPTVQWLAEAPAGPVLELPWDHETMGYGGRYIYWSTSHWQRMVNGWGGFYPKGAFELGVLGKLFPGPHAADTLRQTGIRYVVVHVDLIPADRPGRRARVLSQAPLPEGVRLAARIGPHFIYELQPMAPSAPDPNVSDRAP